MHVVVTNPHPRRRSTATVFYYVLYRISRTRCALPPRNRCQPGKRLTSATRSIKPSISTYIYIHALLSSTIRLLNTCLIIVNYRLIFNTRDVETMVYIFRLFLK